MVFFVIICFSGDFNAVLSPEFISKMEYKLDNPPNFVTFNDCELHKTSFASFDTMRRKGKLCDVTLTSECKRFAAHKIVLAATIPFFNGMFLSNMSETNKNEISMLGVDACALEAFIGFAYTGSIQLTPYNVQSLLIGASFLQLNSIRNICCKYIEERLSPSTVLTVRSFAQSFMCNNLVAACENYLFDHFEAVSQTEAFLTIDGEEFLSLLDSDDLCVTSEERLFQLVINWIEYEGRNNKGASDAPTDPYSGAASCGLSEEAHGLDQLPWSSCRPWSCSEQYLPLLQQPVSSNNTTPKESRVSLLPELLKRIRLPLIPAAFISSVISKHRLIRENIRCRDLLDEVRDMLLLRDRTASSFSCRPRRGQDVFGIIYAVGGLTANGDSHGIVETYHPSLGRWELAEQMPSQRSRIGVVALNGRLYAIGGFDGTARLNTTEMYDPKTKVWKTVAPMNHRRSALGAAALDGRIYVCGGYDGAASLRTCEVYIPHQDKWLLIPSMNEPRSAGGLVALSNGCLYAVGGHNGLAIYSSVECYNRRAVGPSAFGFTTGDHTTANGQMPATSRILPSTPWQPVARMIHRRCRHGVTALRNRIIVAGGYNGVTFLQSVEVFDPAAGPDANGVMGQWTEIAPLGVPRSRVGLAVTGGRLYAIGGYDGSTHLRTVECFQPPPAYVDSSAMGMHEGSGRLQPANCSFANQIIGSQDAFAISGNCTNPRSFKSSDEEGENDDEEMDEGTSSASTCSNPATTITHSTESQNISQLESHTAVKRDAQSHRSHHPSVAQGSFSNWTWIPAASLVAHEGWVGVGVLPLDEPALSNANLYEVTRGHPNHTRSNTSTGNPLLTATTSSDPHLRRGQTE
ncbi:hypothetical protein EG68_05685 [Paragonimus skrjabini miyazakii]|uniref:BTB domain-containing protein n=1 Tax=Paragonimus skrjabini miyazakii TaxID=59628 RepID=A0A8S9YBA9_9TREM|nr:hypothetical protein EG68_05685 [Paragonimus skrjabini miyazakii]